MTWTVKPIESKAAYPLLLDVHYAHRIPSISFAFGVFHADGEMFGVVTYGRPATAPTRKGLLGPELADRVWELNRLCLAENIHNAASYLVSRSLKLMPSPTAILSFADPTQGHTGTIYQAANFLYCGLSAKRTDWQIKGYEHLHNQAVVDMFRGEKDRAAAARARFGDDFKLVDRPRKHRYVYLLGNKKQVREMRAALKYPTLPYPKKDDLA